MLEVHGERNKNCLNLAVERSLRQAALLDEVKDRLDDPAVDLSGGQQQRLCIARSLADWSLKFFFWMSLLRV